MKMRQHPLQRTHKERVVVELSSDRLTVSRRPLLGVGRAKLVHSVPVRTFRSSPSPLSHSTPP